MLRKMLFAPARRKQALCASMWLQMHHSIQHRSIQYAAVVAGAGPAGLAVLGNLLDNNVGGKVLWVDPEFNGGRLNKQWREVPSNTKVNLFVEYANGTVPFRKVLERSRDKGPLEALEGLPQDKGCQISHAADMCVMLSDGMRGLEEVEAKKGSVNGASFDSKSSTWTIEMSTATKADQAQATHPTVCTSRLILCTGSYPTTHPLPIPNLQLKRLHLDTALTPSQLSPLLAPNATLAVIGASHSAILVLLNLYTLASTTHPELRVKWFTRQSLKYAEYRENYILNDNTGLKGSAATFAREQLEDAKLPTSDAGRFISKVDLKGGYEAEQAAYQTHLPSCEYIVQATGFSRNPLPMMARDGRELKVVYDHDTGGFGDEQGQVVKGLYGAGIAFPERVRDPEGTVEYAVGMWKFMKFLRRVTGSWIKGAGHGQGQASVV